MALIAVLWIVAALSIMVIGLTSTVRDQIRTTGAQRDQVSGQAVGEGAMALALQALQASPAREAGIVSLSVPYGGADVAVEIAPLNGLIPLNGAGAPLLAALLQHAGGLDAGRAQTLAAELVAWRDGRPDVDPTGPAAAAAVQPRRFEAPEDLMLVPGVNYTLYARLAPLVSADLAGGNQVNPLAAPPAVLAVLAQGDTGRAAAYAQQRQNQPGADASGFQGGFVGASGTDLYRLQARVPLGEGKILLLTRDVALGAAYAGTAPWRILRTQRQILFPAA